MVRVFVGVFLAIGFNSVAFGATEPRKSYFPDYRDSSFASFLMAREVSIEGTVVSVDRAPRAVSGGCVPATPGLVKYGSLEVHVVRVWAGVVSDSVITLTSLSPLRAADAPGPGSLVVVWGHRDAQDGWRLTGSFAPIPRGGELPASFRNRVMTGVRPEATISELRSEFEKIRWRTPTDVLSGKKGLILVRITSVVPAPHGTRLFRVQYLGDLVGSRGQPPSEVAFAITGSCIYTLAAGDSLVLPAGTGGRLDLQMCPRMVRVECGYLPGLGVALTEVAGVVRMKAGATSIDQFRSTGR